jgi:hypothetical protein
MAVRKGYLPLPPLALDRFSAGSRQRKRAANRRPF